MQSQGDAEMTRVIGFLGLVLAIWLVVQMQVDSFRGVAGSDPAVEQGEGPSSVHRNVRDRMGDENRLVAERLAKQLD